MKKTIAISFLAILAIAGCKKKENEISQLVTVSYPTVTLTGPQFYSIHTGGTIPTVSATAYDSFYHETDQVTIDASAVDNTTPGLYIILVNAKNKYGYIGSANVYLAVTNQPESQDLTGTYVRAATGGVANVTKIANGLYQTDNVGGVDQTVPGNAPFVVTAYFAVTNDSTIDFGVQPTSAGTLTVSSPKLILSPGDTSYSYKLNLSGFSATSVRTFVKQ